MYSTNHLLFKGFGKLFDFPLSEHFDFLLNSIGLIFTILGILLFSILLIIKIIPEFTPENGSKTWGVILACIPIGAIVYSFMENKSFNALFSNFDFSTSIVITNYWDNLRLFFTNPENFIILSDDFFLYLEFSSWIILTIFFIKNLTIYLKERKKIDFSFYKLKILLVFSILVLLLNIVKTYYVLIIHPEPLEYIAIMSLIILLNGVFENINMSLSMYSSLVELKNKYNSLYIVLLFLFLTIVYMCIKMILPELLTLKLDNDSMLFIKYGMIFIYVLILFPIVKYYYFTIQTIEYSETIYDNLKSYFTISMIVLCTFINFKLLLPIMFNNAQYSVNHSFDLLFSLLLTFSIIYLARIFSSKEIIVFSTFVWIYFFGSFAPIIVDTIISIFISSILLTLLIVISKILNRDDVNGLFGMPLVVVYIPLILCFAAFMIENTMIYILFWGIVLIAALLFHHVFKFLGSLFFKKEIENIE